MNPGTVKRFLVTMVFISFACIVIAMIYHQVKNNGAVELPMVYWTMGSFAILVISLISYIRAANRIRVIYENSAVISCKTGEILRINLAREYVWKKKMKDIFTIALRDLTATTGMSVTPITDNPKVRKLKYNVSISAGFSDQVTLIKFLKKAWASFGSGLQYWTIQQDAIQKIVEYELYEFNEAHSKSLAIFYNPMDSVQQKIFVEFLQLHLAPTIEPFGLTITGGSFELA